MLAPVLQARTMQSHLAFSEARLSGGAARDGAGSKDTKEAQLDRRDVRRGGRWTRSQQLKNTAIVIAIRCALFLVDRAPRGLLLAGGRAAGRLWHVLGRGGRRMARQLVRQTLPSADSSSIVRQSYENAGCNLARCLLLRRKSFRALELVEVDQAARQTLETALAEGRGVVFVSPHLGPFELVAAAVAELGHRPVAVVRESYDPRLDPIVDHHRRLHGVAVIHRGAPAAALRIVRALRDGRPVGLLPDLQSRVPSTACELLGQPWMLPVGPQRIALWVGAPLLVGSLAPAPMCPAAQPKCFQLEIRRIEPAGDEAALTRCVADALSSAIERMPDHWLWMAQRHR